MANPVIHLSAGDVAVASTVAAIRQGVNRQSNVTNQKAGQQDPITTELVGIFGEFAFARWANVMPDLSTHLRKGGQDAIFRGWTVDVKSTRNPNGLLYVDARADKLANLYVLVHVEYAACTLLGWVWSGEIPSRADMTQSPVVIPQHHLDEMRALWEIEPKA